MIGDTRNAIMVIDHSKHNGESVAQMLRTVDVFEADILSELEEWDALEKMIDVSVLQGPTML